MQDIKSLSELSQSVTQRNLENLSPDEAADTIAIISSWLGQLQDVEADQKDLDSILGLSKWISKALLPSGELKSYEEFLSENEIPLEAIQLSQQKAETGLNTLTRLHKILTAATTFPHPNLDPQIFLALLAFTNPRDPWTTPASLDQAQALLTLYPSQTQSSDVIVSFLLQKFIRPLFSHSKPSAITSTGRKAMPTSEPSRRYEAKDQDRSTKPWKYDKIYAITVFEWAVGNISKETLTESWNLFIPPLLTLLDDTSTPVRVRGLEILSVFLPNLTSKLLLQTGLGEVFEDAVTPTLLYLPTLTPVEESVVLLPAAYSALFALSNLRFDSDSGSLDEKTERQRIQFLDKMLRDGIMTGYLHASSHHAIVEILITQLSLVIRKLEIHSVKHLNKILPILTSVLVDPFSISKPTLLKAAIEGVQTVTLNAWPRIIDEDEHRLQVMKGLVLCWTNVKSEEKDGVDMTELIEMLKDTARVLMATIQSNGVDKEAASRREIEAMVKVAPLLEGLFDLEGR